MQVVWKNQKELRCGYTTGSCAAAAAKAAAAMLFSGEEVRQVSLMTPKGIELYLEVEEIQRENESVSCAIQKDSGDDPDVTNGIFVYAKITKKKEKGMNLRWWDRSRGALPGRYWSRKPERQQSTKCHGR